MPAPHRRTVLALLARHDVPDIGAQAIRQWGVDLRNQLLRTRQELAAFVNVETGDQLGRILQGTDDYVDVGPLLRLMVPGQRYACIHTHPEDASFSPANAALVVRFRAVCVIAVVDSQGSWYVLSAASGQVLPSSGEVYDAFIQEYDTLTPKYVQLVQDGTVTRREARRRHSHEVWERIAPALGLRYDRA